MRTATKSITALLSAGIVVAALAGCSQSGTGSAPTSGAGTSSSASATPSASAGVLTFPITGGNVTYYDPASKVRPYVQGELDHTGSGLSLTAGSTKVELKNFVIDPGNDSHVSGDVYLNGKIAAKGANLFRLDGTTLNPVTKSGDAYVLQGTTVYVSDDAAALLNKVFKTTAVTGDLKVGIATLTVTGS